MWLFLHSGSRGVGNKIAQRHIAIAQRLAEQWWIDLPDPDLAYLVEGTPSSRATSRELRWAQHFALLNREEMMDRVVRQLERVDRRAGGGAGADQLPPQLHRAGDALRQGGVGVPQGRHPGGAGQPGLIPARWARRRTSSRG